MSVKYFMTCRRTAYIAAGVLLMGLSANAQIQPMGSAAIDSVASAPCESITPIPDNLKGLIPESCEVRPPTIVTPALQRPLRAWSLKRYSEPQKYGPSKTKFWAMWGLNGGLTVVQVESAVHRAHMNITGSWNLARGHYMA